ncbi:MAG: hypothetical protein ACRDPE_15205 [Solirubrobacterales bacterium]
MARDDLGVRVEKVATKKVKDGRPTVEKNIVGWANRVLQLGAYVDPSSAEVATIQVGEVFVMMVGGKHELPISATAGDAPVGTVEGDLLFIKAADNTIKKAKTKEYMPLGVVEEVDAVRGVALVNTNELNAFLLATE